MKKVEQKASSPKGKAPKVSSSKGKAPKASSSNGKVPKAPKVPKELAVFAEPLNGKTLNKPRVSRLWPILLPMSTGVPLLPMQSAQITARPQCAFRPGRLVIEDAVGLVVNDIKIGTRSQLAQSGDVPGRVFAPDALDTFGGDFDAAPAGTDVVIVVTNVGKKKAPVFAAFLGTKG